MARSGRKRKLASRYPCGKIRKEEAKPESERKPREPYLRPLRQGDRVYRDRVVAYRQGYPVISLNGRVYAVHVLVWEKANGPRPEGMHIHHKNENRADWRLSNLELLSPLDHSRTHHEFRKTNGEWTHKLCSGCDLYLPFSEFSPSGKGLQSRCRPCRSEYVLDLEKQKRAKHAAGGVA